MEQAAAFVRSPVRRFLAHVSQRKSAPESPPIRTREAKATRGHQTELATVRQLRRQSGVLGIFQDLVLIPVDEGGNNPHPPVSTFGNQPIGQLEESGRAIVVISAGVDPESNKACTPPGQKQGRENEKSVSTGQFPSSERLAALCHYFRQGYFQMSAYGTRRMPFGVRSLLAVVDENGLQAAGLGQHVMRAGRGVETAAHKHQDIAVHDRDRVYSNAKHVNKRKDTKGTTRLTANGRCQYGKIACGNQDRICWPTAADADWPDADWVRDMQGDRMLTSAGN